MQFTFIPPRSDPLAPQAKDSALITATCSDCSNTAQQNIALLPFETCEGNQGNPINPANATKVQNEADFTDDGVHPLSFARNYRSNGTSAPAGLGTNWGHSFAGAAALSTDILSINLDLGDGGSASFLRADANAAWVNNNSTSTDQLTNAGSDVILKRADDSQWRFAVNGSSGRLTSITQRNGWTTSLGYNAAGQLTTVTNHFGRSLQLAYNAIGQLTQITQPDGGRISYEYDSIGRVFRVGYPDNSFKIYHYERTDLPQALTGITDETGNRFSTFEYDTAGRASSTQYAGSANRFKINYGTALQPTSSSNTDDPALFQASAQVTDPLGNPRSIMFQGGDGNVRVLSQSSPADSLFANRAFLPNTSLPSQETDFLGFTTQYSWDTIRRLKTSETQAAGRPEAQTVQTQWHPSLRLPAQIIEQGKTTAYTYDNLGNVLTQTETDTTGGSSNGKCAPGATPTTPTAK